MTDLLATNVSHRLSEAGFALVSPDRRRAGMSVKRGPFGTVTVSGTYDEPQVDMAEYILAVIKTLGDVGYFTMLISRSDKYFHIDVSPIQ